MIEYRRHLRGFRMKHNISLPGVALVTGIEFAELDRIERLQHCGIAAMVEPHVFAQLNSRLDRIVCRDCRLIEYISWTRSPSMCGDYS